MERIKQIVTDNVSYITIAELNDLLERKDNLNPQESFMLGVNVGRVVERSISRNNYTPNYTYELNTFIEGMMQEKPAIIKKDLKGTVREYIEELKEKSENFKESGYTAIFKSLNMVLGELKYIVGDFENDTDARLNFKTRSAEKLYSDFKSIEECNKAAEVKNALNQTEKETITENHRLTKYP